MCAAGRLMNLPCAKPRDSDERSETRLDRQLRLAYTVVYAVQLFPTKGVNHAAQSESLHE